MPYIVSNANEVAGQNMKHIARIKNGNLYLSAFGASFGFWPRDSTHMAVHTIFCCAHDNFDSTGKIPCEMRARAQHYSWCEAFNVLFFVRCGRACNAFDVKVFVPSVGGPVVQTWYRSLWPPHHTHTIHTRNKVTETTNHIQHAHKRQRVTFMNILPFISANILLCLGLQFYHSVFQHDTILLLTLVYEHSVRCQSHTHASVEQGGDHVGGERNCHAP